MEVADTDADQGQTAGRPRRQLKLTEKMAAMKDNITVIGEVVGAVASGSQRGGRGGRGRGRGGRGGGRGRTQMK